ncbi:MAG: alpha/beta hydrolase family protein [Polyangiaceae bacterium]|nr:alpha/beta hydrolase family protein [Polyangiaceae bacterium]MCW5789761.1 alpha/beta hydrolase family protein [Polyangiaceae bacterium]
MSRLLHLRGAKHNTVAQLGPYLDLPVGELFPEPPPLTQVKVTRRLVDRALRTSTLTWRSQHQVVCQDYAKRHYGEYARNLTAHARWIRADTAMRRTCLIYVHGWLEPGSWVEEATLFRSWTKQLPVDIVHVSLPFHGPRNPPGSLFSGEYFWSADLVRSIEGVRQGVCDVRGIMSWLRAQGYERVGVTGISLGGSLTMVTGCVSPTPDFIAPIISHLQLQDAVEQAPILWRMKRDLTSWGVDREERHRLFGRLGLASYRPLIERERQLWIEAEEDAYIDAHLVEKQWQAWGEPPILWIPGGHMSFPLSVPKMTERMAKFLEELPARRAG